jgi:outer membrane protein OmpA-like peptidoglycan-associated protein
VKNKIVWIGVVIVLGCCLTTVQAFDWFGGRLSVGGGYGRAKPKLPYSYQDSDQDGQMWTAHLKYDIDDSFAVVASYADMQPYNRTTSQPIRFRPIMGSLRYNLFRHLPFTPYLTAGAGVSINKKDIPGAPSVKWDALALQGGAGLEFFINQGTSLGAEALYHNFVADNHNVPYRLVSLVGMVNVYFGKGPLTQQAEAEAEQAKADAQKAQAEAQALAQQQQTQQAQAEADKAEAARKAQDLQNQVKLAQAEMDQIKEMVAAKNIAPINFKTGSSDLLVESHATLDKVAEIAKKYTNLKLRVEGHTDSTGGTDFNQQLSQERADAVRDYLVKTAGVPADQVVAVGFGQTKPVASNATAQGRAQNRRVEFIFFIK